MIRRSAAILAVLSLCPLGASQASAAPPEAHAAWRLTLSSQPTNFEPGSSKGTYLIVATNVGAKASEGPITITDTLPDTPSGGLTPTGASGLTNDFIGEGPECQVVGKTVTCTSAGPIRPGLSIWVTIGVQADNLPDPTTLPDEATISGGGALEDVSAQVQSTVSDTVAPFGFLGGESGFSASLNSGDGGPTTHAGDHPYQLTATLGFPTESPPPGGPLSLTNTGHPRDAVVELPRGLTGDPAATPVLCTEAELTSQGNPGCPDASQVGLAITTILATNVGPRSVPLFNMVPPPGSPASFGFDAGGYGVFIHVLGSVRSDSDYGIDGEAHDILALGANPILATQVSLWGKPSDKGHDFARNKCLRAVPRLAGPCEVPEEETALLTLPGECTGQAAITTARTDSWEEPSPPFEEREAAYENATLNGVAKAFDGCNELKFEPSFSARPSTNLADSPTGLEVDLRQPQETGFEGRSTAMLKDATLAFPEGLTVNASSGDGLGACTSGQIGLTTPVGQADEIRFAKQPDSCPDSAKLGTMEVTTPLLAQRDAEHELALDGEGKPKPEPLHGSVYLAKPFDNPFDSLIAVYLSIADPKSGTIAKLAGEVTPDPATGRLSTTFEENPELPLQDIKVNLFGGSRAGLQTPPACGAFQSTMDLTPWSAPEGAVAHLADSFQTTASPGGGPCAEPNAPALSAGTLSPQGGTYSPLVARLSRPDGSQRLARFELTLPPGLTARPAGVAECSEAQIAAAQARSGTGDGALEQAHPSCPAASEVGSLDVGAGAGPAPLHVQGRAYLAGPYEGAPLSLVTIVPAIAGPFDLGAVVVRAPVHVDPTTGQPRAVSDPFPQILHGIPVDVRSVTVRADRSQFTLNPTSCDPELFSGAATSVLGGVAPLSERFQVGGCRSLPYKPRLFARLFGPTHRGAHPRLRAVFLAKPGEAASKRIVFALPHSEFIDQSHFRTICTRVQFAADACPPGSVYGRVRAFTPLLDYPLEGPVYLRSSDHELPDAVIRLRGPAYQPIEVVAAGRVDSVHGGIRTSFESLPDAPLSKVVVITQGKRKGLFQNSTNLCRSAHFATVRLDGQNGKAHDFRAHLSARCARHRHRHGHRRR